MENEIYLRGIREDFIKIRDSVRELDNVVMTGASYNTKGVG